MGYGGQAMGPVGGGGFVNGNSGVKGAGIGGVGAGGNNGARTEPLAGGEMGAPIGGGGDGKIPRAK